MEANNLVSLVSNVGFPIAVCIYLFYSNEKLRGVIEENTKAITALTFKVECIINHKEV